MYFEKKLKEIEMKMPKLGNISISQIPTTPDRNYKLISSNTMQPLSSDTYIPSL
jgi:hypothetical protein